MAWSGSNFTRVYGSTGWQDDAALGTGIVADRHDTQDNDLATGINACINKNGANTPTANLPMGGFKHTNVANASANTEYMAFGQISNGSTTVNVGSATFNGDVTVNGPRSLIITASSLSNAQGNNFVATETSTSKTGSVGIYKHSGITNPCGYLSLTPEGATQRWLWVDNVGDFRIGTAIANIGTTSGTVVGTQTSDERLKIVDQEPFPYGLDTVSSIQPVRFAYTNDPQNKKVGFVAQQVKPIVPESVYSTGDVPEGFNPDQPILAMNYSSLIPVLVSACKELKAKCEALEARVAALGG